MNKSKAHIPSLKARATQVPREEAATEGVNTENEIDQFTHGPEDTP